MSRRVSSLLVDRNRAYYNGPSIVHNSYIKGQEKNTSGIMVQMVKFGIITRMDISIIIVSRQRSPVQAVKKRRMRNHAALEPINSLSSGNNGSNLHKRKCISVTGPVVDLLVASTVFLMKSSMLFSSDSFFDV